MIEVLESRIAPAATFTFTDVDGDLVTIKTSKGTNADLAAIITKAVVIAGTIPKEQLQEIDFSANAAVFAGTNLTITAKRTAEGGDGLANVGYIDASDSDGGTSLLLGVVKIAGDLGRIRVGAVLGAAPVLKFLDVQSLGQFGTSTQGAGASLVSLIEGDFGALKVRGNLVDASIQVLGDLGSVKIGGSLVGGAFADTGFLSVNGDIGSVKIGVNLEGGEGTASGRIVLDGNLQSLTIGGSMIGGDGTFSAAVIVGGSLGSAKIGRDLRGLGTNSAYINADRLGSLTVGGSIIGEQNNSGEVRIANNIGAVKVGGDIRRSALSFGSGIFSDSGMIANVKIGGSLLGATVSSGGAVGVMGIVAVGGDVDNGRISSNDALAGVTVGGSLIGRGDNNRGEIRSSSDMGPVRIGGSVVGGSGIASGVVISGGKLASLTIGGSVVGGSSLFAGSVLSGEAAGKIRVGVDLVGGSAQETGSLKVDGDIAAIEIRGSILGGSGNETGMVAVGGKITSLVLGGDLRGASIGAPGMLDTTGAIRADRLALVKIGGSIFSGTSSGGGTLLRSGAILADHDIGSLSIGGDIAGNASQVVLISASGQELPSAGQNVAIKSVTVKGTVERANILAGYSASGVGNNADAQIGTVVVGNWIASNLIAGLTTGGDSFFGDDNDAKIVSIDDGTILSKIGSIIIKGQVIGNVPTDSLTFGFGAEQVGSIKVGKTAILLTAGGRNDTFASGGAVSIGPTRTTYVGVGDGYDVHAYEV